MYTGFYDIGKRPGDRELTLSEWIKTIKQLGLMHIVYYKARDCYQFSYQLYKAYGRRRGQPTTWEYFLYQTTNTERKLFDYLDRWEKEYKERWQKGGNFLNTKSSEWSNNWG